MMRGLVIDMNDEQLPTLAELQALLDGTVAAGFAVAAEARYDFIARTVRRFGDGRLKRADKGVVLHFLERVRGYSRQPLTRLVKRGGERRPLSQRYRASRTRFARTYTSAEVLLRAPTDTWHGTRSGLATKHSWSAPMASSAMPALRAWPPSRWRIWTTCVSAPAIRVTARSGPRLGR